MNQTIANLQLKAPWDWLAWTTQEYYRDTLIHMIQIKLTNSRIMLTSRTSQFHKLLRRVKHFITSSIEVSLNYPIKNGTGFSSNNNNWLIRGKKGHTKMPIYIAYKYDFRKETSSFGIRTFWGIQSSAGKCSEKVKLGMNRSGHLVPRSIYA